AIARGPTMIEKHALTDTLVEEEPGEEPSAGRWAWLICIGSPEDKFATAGRVLPLEGPREVTFGRDESSDGLSASGEGQQVRVGSPFGWVSGRHAALRVTEVGPGLPFSPRALGSRNGTLVNGERLHDAVRLRPADVFE